ncbi:MAG: hypothetical protein ACFCVE_09750 [Phycisphaerae bacterium]
MDNPPPPTRSAPTNPAPTNPAPTRLEYEDCYAEWDGRRLAVGNAAFERVWRVQSRRLEAASIVAGGRAWAERPGEMSQTGESPVSAGRLTKTEAFNVVHTPGLCVELMLTGDDDDGSGGETAYAFELFPNAAVLRLRQSVRSTRPADAAGSQPPTDNDEVAGVETGVEDKGVTPTEAAKQPHTPDAFVLAPRHVRLERITLHGRSDERYERVQTLVHPEAGRERHLDVFANLLSFEDVTEEAGLVLLRHAMSADVRPAGYGGLPDYRVHGGRVEVLDALAREVADGVRVGDWHAMLFFAGGTPGRTAALQAYDRLLRPLRLGGRGTMLSNTWGDRNRDARVNETFVLGEIQAARRLGVDVVQIDDGWQAGRTSNSAQAAEAGGRWEGFWDTPEGQPRFWDADPHRFPNGLRAVSDAAGAAGLELGLWYAPDSAAGFANWRKDADELLRLHRALSVRHFKLDSINITDDAGLMNLERLFDALAEESGGRIIIDLDATAGRRGDYLHRPEAGVVFVENRYTDWLSYWPHLTLRAVWQLAHVADPRRLRIEWLNPDRNADKYGDDPLAPAAYGADYLFAITAMTSPLAWMELQHLPEHRVAEAKPVIDVWRQTREALAGATVYPVGDEPDGRGWCGFFADGVQADGGSVKHLLVFGEPLARSEGRLELPAGVAGGLAGTPRRLAGEAACRVEGGACVVTAGRTPAFGWFAFEG